MNKLERKCFEQVVKALEANTGSDKTEAISTLKLMLNKGVNSTIEGEVANALREIGVPANVAGYKYLVSAVLEAVKNPDAVYHIQKNIYEKLSTVYGTSWRNIERNIRWGIELSAERSGAEKIWEFFGSSISIKTGKPTNAAFIGTVANVVKERTRED